MVFIEAGDVQPMAALPPNPCHKSMVTIIKKKRSCTLATSKSNTAIFELHEIYISYIRKIQYKKKKEKYAIIIVIITTIIPIY